MSSPILLILGAGSNIGDHVARAFAAKDFRLALASRKVPANKPQDALHIPVDLSKPENVPHVFETVKAKLGSAPSIVVYNCASHTPDNKADPLANFSLEAYIPHQNLNHNSVLVALQQSVLGFRSLTDPAAAKTFIYTGNILNAITLPERLTFGLGKNATAYAIRTLVEGEVYTAEGVSFYYTDERKSTGAPVIEDISGSAAAEEYVKLAERTDQGPWLYTFVKGDGYKDFSGKGISVSV
ncbi:hypothetical protein H2200_005136 [Cladophialophora chaetospira]|uniref:Short-chain dehydrogenase n=1 Tax=Cladophialophora chaetospira TaxID=386627 RepID=A0AA38XBI1_9EURO|nr:hypothetical protein H2200_005136 [Cladophialophora chaetospira]